MLDASTSGRWWTGAQPSGDIAERLAQVVLARCQALLPIVIIGLVTAVIVSEPTGIPITWPVLALNAVMISCAAILLMALRRNRIPTSRAHLCGAAVWLFTPFNTLMSLWMTGSDMLILPLTIELACLGVLLDPRTSLVASAAVVGAAFALLAQTHVSRMSPTALLGAWVVGMATQLAIRRSVIRAETHRLELQRALEALRVELAERQRAEHDREQLRDQFVHAQRMDAVGTLAAGLAHDMNNILGGILAFAEILAAEAKDPSVREDIDRIRHEAERGAALTRGLLAFSRRGAYRKQPIMIGNVLDDIAPLLERTLGKNITLERKGTPIAIVEGDPAQLGQVLINLCLNGADAMEGNGTLTIETSVVDLTDGNAVGLPAGTYACLAVADTGAGMDDETRKRMFEPFFTTKPVGKGTGLGLAMVYGAVQAHGGAIDVESAPGRGTTITIYLPTVDAAPSPLPRVAPRTTGRHGLVLIVDDEPTMRAGVARLIERLGLTAVLASNGAEAQELFQQRRGEVVLVLLDMVMPQMDGPACFRKLRDIAVVPVLLMSGYTEHAAAQELLATGANGFLEKPFTLEQLEAEVDRILGRSSPA